MFGTNDLVYVPQGQPLIFDDVYHWRRFKINTGAMSVRIRPAAFEEVRARVESTLGLISTSPRFADSIGRIHPNVTEMVRDMAAFSGFAGGGQEGNLREFARAQNASWWLSLSDLPTETYSDDDYERPLVRPADAILHPTYGSVKISQLDGLEVALPGSGEDAPFALEVPNRDGLTRWTIPPQEPLPLIHEFCGTHGVSAFGRTTNVTTLGEVSEAHNFCTPVGRLGNKLLMTLYFYYQVTIEGPVMGKLREEQVGPLLEMLERSKFDLTGKGPTHRIYAREGDVVHVYSGLAGKETEGTDTMPPFMLVTSASGETDPLHRADLFDAIAQQLARG